MTPDEKREFNEWLRRAEREMFPKMKDSAMSLVISGEPDAKLCLEVGAAILYDKPILVVVPKGRRVPRNLQRIAERTVEIDFENPDPLQQAKLERAISEIVAKAASKKEHH